MESMRGTDYLRPAIVLLIEDSDEDAAAVQECFEIENIQVDMERYSTADESIIRLTQKPVPDIVFIDQNLAGSEISGYELTKSLCENPSFFDTQIVVLTQTLSEKERVEFTNMGIRAFIPKPLDAGTLRDFVKDNKEDFIFQLMRKVRKVAA
jgi:DNA-binding response OmpR family regulator